MREKKKRREGKKARACRETSEGGRGRTLEGGKNGGGREIEHIDSLFISKEQEKKKKRNRFVQSVGEKKKKRRQKRGGGGGR